VTTSRRPNSVPDVATQDPDAIWKPGYTGEIVYRPSASATTRPPRRRLVLAAAIAAAAVTAVLVVSRFTAEHDANEPSGLERIPTQIRERWTATLESPLTAVTGTADSIVALAGIQLVTLDARSGTERWRVPAPSAVGDLEVIDDVIVFRDVAGAEQSLSGFDLHDGHRLWSKTFSRGPATTFAQDALVIPGFSAGGMVTFLEFLDPWTGSRMAAFEGEEVTMSSTAIRRRVDDVVEWYDRDTFDLQARADLASLALDPFPTAGAPTDAGLVIAAFDRAWLLDGDGAVASSLALSRKLVAPWRLDELDGSGRYLVLQGVDTTTLLTIRDGRLEELWTRRVVPIGSLVDYEQTILTVQGWDSEWTPTGLQVLDATTGRALGRNGFVAGTEPADDGSWSLVAYDLEGTELWRLPVPTRGLPALLPGALLVADDETESRATILTLLS
jgi:outer membrane protein assembly factor BamB